MEKLMVTHLIDKNAIKCFRLTEGVEVVNKEPDYNDYDERGCMSY